MASSSDDPTMLPPTPTPTPPPPRRSRRRSRPAVAAPPTATATAKTPVSASAEEGQRAGEHHVLADVTQQPPDPPVADSGRPDQPMSDTQRLATKLLMLKGARAERAQAAGAIEADERRRAKTPLSLQLVVMSCHWASERWLAGQDVPEYSFPTRQCHLGKTVPDQDCRLCRYCKPLVWGSQFTHAERRYHEFGSIFPVPVGDEANTADALGQFLADHDIHALRDVGQEIAALDQQILRMEAEQQAAARTAGDIAAQMRLARAQGVLPSDPQPAAQPQQQ